MQARFVVSLLAAAVATALLVLFVASAQGVRPMSVASVSKTNISRMFSDNSTGPVTNWVGSNHGVFIVEMEPLD